MLEDVEISVRKRSIACEKKHWWVKGLTLKYLDMA